MEHVNQLYQYNQEAFVIDTNSSDFFAENFNQIIITNPKDTFWLNFHSLTCKESIESLFTSLNIDKLTIENIYKTEKRPKIEEYPDYLFFTVRSALSKGLNSFFLNKDQISFILGKNFLISIQSKKAQHFEDVRDRIEKKRGKIRFKGPDFLLFRLLESITDNYFEVLDDIVNSIEKIEHRLIHKPDNEILKEIENQKRKLIELRKIVFPLKEIASHLERVINPLIDKSNHYYFSEIKDNCITVLEEIDDNKQILDGFSNLYFAVQGQRMNQVMKLLTVVSAIFIPLTFIVGVYGMNFEKMPELSMKYGYYICWGIMVAITGILLFAFYKRGWFK
jgi:magnesium transporter